MMPAPALYTGTLRHRRFQPRRHEFTYRIFLAFLDIDRIPEVMNRSRWSSYNRFNWASFEERDHFGDPSVPLRQRIAADAGAHGIALPDGPIFLLTHLRYLGYCFNPISFFFCYNEAGELGPILAEVNSTFGESYNYWLGPDNREKAPGAGRRHRCPKQMHVSPFMSMALDYEFVLTDPGATLVARMNTIERNGSAAAPPPFFDATLVLDRQEWTPGNLAQSLCRHPWMTAQVIIAIHWQALKLFLKRVPVFTHPGRSPVGDKTL